MQQIFLRFIFFVLIPFMLAYILVALSSKPLIKLLQKLGFIQFIREEIPASHKNKQSTPTAGGLVFVLVLFITYIYYLICYNYLFHPSGNTQVSTIFPYTKPIPIIMLGASLIGFLDDYLKKVKKQNEGLKPKQKLLAQIILASGFAWSLQRTETIIFGLHFELGLILFLVFTFCVLAGSMNATNLTDGLDGLASSVMGWSYLGLGLLILLKNPSSSESIMWSFALAGACFGFLWLNGYPAKVFMGDTGSFLLGGGIATIALIEKLEWYLIFLSIIPIWETLSVILQILCCKLSKKYLKKDLRPFKMTPFHHHLELSGWNEKQIVWVLAFSQFAINSITLGLVWSQTIP